MSKLLRRLRDESGQTMMLVVFAIALVSTLAVGLTDLVASEAQSRGQAASSDSAYQAAEAGIDSYASKLLDDQLYYFHYVADGESRPRVVGEPDHSCELPAAAIDGATDGGPLDRQHHLDVPVRPGQLESARERLRLQPRDHGPEAAPRPRSRRRSRSSRPAAGGTPPSASAARRRTRRNARSRRCSSPRRPRTSR